MKLKKGFILVLVLCMAVQLLCACSDKSAVVSEKLHIGVTYYNQSDTFLNGLLESFREQLGELEKDGMEITVTIRDAAGSQRTQNDQVKELIDAGCSLLCVNLVDRADPSEIIDLARDNDDPIIFFNREPVAEDLMQWEKLYYVGGYADQAGIMQGELAAEAILSDDSIDRNKDGKIQYVILEGEAGHQDAIIRTENAVDTLRNSGVELEKLSYQIANWNRAQAQNRMEQMVSQYHDEIELVLANNDDMALGAIDAYKKLNYAESDSPVVFGIDGTDVGLQAVLDSDMRGTVYNDKEGQAEAMIQLAVAIATGEGMQEISFEKERCIYLPHWKITRENVEDYIKDSGEAAEERTRGSVTVNTLPVLFIPGGG